MSMLEARAAESLLGRSPRARYERHADGRPVRCAAARATARMAACAAAWCAAHAAHATEDLGYAAAIAPGVAQNEPEAARHSAGRVRDVRGA